MWQNAILYTQPKLRYGHLKFYELPYILFYSSIACENQNLKNNFKITVRDELFVV